MVLTPTILTIISIVYGVLAIRMAFAVWKGRKSLFDDTVTPEDMRLANGIAFYFLWPPVVLLHEGGHALVAALFGAQGIRLHYFGYWGEITYPNTLTNRQDWWVALAGNVVSYTMGIALALAARYGRVTLIWRIILASAAMEQWYVVLFWYPLLCLTGSFQGDFNVIYGRAYWWAGSTVTAAIGVVSLIAYCWAAYYEGGKAWVRENLWRAAATPPGQEE
ncbi:MAG: M50 family metallopeptidase [Capsulimonas sp.]|uniref:M50 family metallopeptidase n=1 Tax=Capsulimonas sp. TaxID=2494211 RepID=UPI003267AEEE